MGYHTEFTGKFKITPALKPEHLAFLVAFSNTRRTARNVAKLGKKSNPLGDAVGLPLGVEGAYYVGSKAEMGQDWLHLAPRCKTEGREVSPLGQPNFWCQWMPTEDGKHLEWNGSEKFYDYQAWLVYMIEHFFTPWGYSLTGKVRWSGEKKGDRGTITLVANKFSVVAGCAKTGKISSAPIGGPVCSAAEPVDQTNELEALFS